MASETDAPSIADGCVGVARVIVGATVRVVEEEEGRARTSASSASCQVVSEGCSRHS